VTPLLVRTAHGERDKNGKKRGKGAHSVEAPLPTQPCSNEFALVSPLLVGAGGPGYSGKPVRADQPMGSQTTENHRASSRPCSCRATASAQAKRRAPARRSCRCRPSSPPTTARRSWPPTSPSRTASARRSCSARTCTEPVHTITTKDQKAVVTSHLLKMRHHSVGQDVREPLDTISANQRHALRRSPRAAHQVLLRGRPVGISARSRSTPSPPRTASGSSP
jgi:hypothetical protein